MKLWRRGSEQDFWDEFSDSSGARLTYTAIVNRITCMKKEEDHKLAEEARARYGNNFEAVFSYRKGVGLVHHEKRE